MEVEDYKRKITHTDYGKAEAGLQQYAHLVDKVITKKPKPFTLGDLAGKKVFLQANLDCLIFNFPSKVAPHIGGGSLGNDYYVSNSLR
ncbi:hypothetical protein [Cellulophaga baltica]|uniref:hypothetical protein n=1 Tax=Cellulophaga baltica TaxID=76594 RepID=UPI0024942D6F|nr:hypothetical protein [Cellulophaga baltica]